MIIKGVGAHGAAPHMSKDPVAAAGAIVSGVHQIVSRTMNPIDTAVISIGYLHGGNAFNVIPDEMILGGTIRLTDTSLYEKLFATLTLRIKSIATAYGCTAEVIDRDGEEGTNSRGEKFNIRAFPPRINDDTMVDLGISTLTKMYGSDTVQFAPPSTGCEDFAFLSDVVPAVSFNVGTKNPKDKKGEKTGVQVCLLYIRTLDVFILVFSLSLYFVFGILDCILILLITFQLYLIKKNQAHNALFDIDERALPLGAAFLSTLSLEYLGEGDDKQDKSEL